MFIEYEKDLAQRAEKVGVSEEKMRSALSAS
jgi:DNA-binding phage protein